MTGTVNKLDMPLDELVAKKAGKRPGVKKDIMEGTTIKVARRIYVGNLAYRTTWQGLKDHFKDIGEITRADIVRDSMTGRSKGCGVVEFATSNDAARAIEELDESTLDERTIYIREDREDPDLKGHLENPDEQPRKIQRREGPGHTGSRYGVRGAYGRGGHGGYGDGGGAAFIGRKLFVQNLSFDVTWKELKDHFRDGGHVTYANVLLDKATGQSKGCGVVEFETPSEALSAIGRFSNTTLKGRQILVREDREDLGGQAGSGGSNGGYGGRGGYSGQNSGAPKARNGKAPPTAASGCTVVVHGIPWSYTWKDLADFVRSAGDVIHTDIVCDQMGRSKGYGTVIFSSSDDAQNAIETYNGTTINGRIVALKLDKFAA